MSTHENPGEPRTSWAAVYATELTIGVTQQLTPHGIADLALQSLLLAFTQLSLLMERERMEW